MVRTTLNAVLWLSIVVMGLTGCEGGKAQISVNSNGAKLMSLSVSPTDPAIAKNTGQQLTATGIYSDNTTRDVTAYVIWSSSDTAVASVGNNPDSSQVDAFQSAMAPPSLDNPGHAFAKAVGKATITATAGDTTASTTLTVTPATLVSISITPTNPSIADGTTQQFIATGTFSDNTTQDLSASVTWSSSSPGVSTINNAGLAASTGTGSATITATSGSVSGSTALTVTAAVLMSLAIAPTNPGIAKGTNQQFIATGTFSDNSTQDLTAAALWSSSDASVVDISNTAGSRGLATSIAVGSATITAASGGVSGSTIMTVKPATLGSISVTPTNPSIAMGTKQQFSATGSYSDGSTQNLTATVVWGSSDTTVATISNAAGSYGLATSLATGPTTITAASGTVSGTATLTVTPATLVSIAVTPVDPSIAKGTKQQFTATGTYSDNSTQNLTTAVTWSSSDTAVATISNAADTHGVASSLTAGTIIISATSGPISASTKLVVTTGNGPNIIQAAGCSLSEIQDAVTTAASGDIVSVPSGSCSWSSSLTITKGITLQGAGIGNTVITAGGANNLIQYQPVNPSLNESYRLTGFTLDGNLTSPVIVYVTNTSTTTTLTNIRIDHNRITNSRNGASDEGVFINGMIYGLIDNNEIVNNATALRLLGNNNYSWNNPLSSGSAKSIYIESNNISGITATNGGYVVLSGWGTRWVFRYNTVDVTGVGDPIFDAHGNLAGGSPPSCDWGDAGGVRGVVGVEIYNNTIINFNRASGKLYDHRGGTGIVFNNTSSGTVNGCNANIQVREEDDNIGIGSCYPLKSIYPGYDPVQDTYVWNNIHNGNAICYVNYDSASMIIDQKDVWSDQKNWSGGPTTFFTKGLSSARGSTCSAGDVYWESDLNKLYRCVGANNWTFIYAPYTFPHPFTAL